MSHVVAVPVYLINPSYDLRHGPLSACPKSITHSLVMEYLDLPDGSPERAILERKFGKGIVLKLVREYEEEKATAEWVQSSTTACPTCHVPVEKSIGCNHVRSWDFHSCASIG